MCWGWGSEFISCGTLSLFTNVTREPAATVTERGDAPLDVMVIVVSVVGVGVGAAPVPPVPIIRETTSPVR